MSYAVARSRGTNGELNKLYPEDRAVHDWYRFVLSFPPHLVRDYIQRFGVNSHHQVLDPFCGTGTVLVECKKLGIPCVGIEVNPMVHFASTVKVDWHPDPDLLIEHARRIAEAALEILRSEGIEDETLFNGTQNEHCTLRMLPAEEMELLLTNSISPLPLHKTLILLDCIKRYSDEQYHKHEILALAKSLVSSISNLRFGPEVGVGAIRTDAPVVSTWLNTVQAIAQDLRKVRHSANTPVQVHLNDSRHVSQILEPKSIDAVFTSPPYPNEKDYTRTTRLEAVLLGFIHNKTDLQTLKKALVCSNTRSVYKGDEDDAWMMNYPEVQKIAETIEARRIELGKTSGFEKLYGKVTKLYFGGMARHLAFLRSILRPNAQLAYVVGDQASYLRVMIPTGKILADIGQSLGYEPVSIDLFRTRFATATKEQLREEVVVLRWPKKSATWSVLSNKNTFPVSDKDEKEDNVISSFSSPNKNDTQNILLDLPLAEDGGNKMTSHPSDDKDNIQNTLFDLTPDIEPSSEKGTEDSSPETKLNRYQKLLEHIFFSKYKDGASEVVFEREELEHAAKELGIKLPKNLGDVIYSFRYRTALPLSIREKAPEGNEWIIRPSGRSRYCFVATTVDQILPREMLSETKVPDATPGIVAMYALGDEQALLAKLRYNRLIDIFTGLTCYSLQNHLRTTVTGKGQVETDEIYVGVDRRGAQYVIPLQAKGGNDKIGIVQIEQDIALCKEKFPSLICRPIAAQFMDENLIALFEFEETADKVGLYKEIHYRLVPPDDMTPQDLEAYRNRSLEE